MNMQEQTILAADADGYRLEFVNGVGIWEASPVFRHQRLVDEIRASIRASAGETRCACVHAGDVLVRFPDDSLKRPDIALFCQSPDDETIVVTLLPEAVIEILSRGYEAKDLEIGVPFYRRMGVKDIVVIDPDTKAILHYQNGQAAHVLTSPTEITFACGCRCTV